MNMIDGWNLTAPKPEKLPPPLERKSQAAVIDWANWASGQWPELRYLFAVPNAAQRSAINASLNIAMGMKAGTPDLWLPVARDGCFGLVIEMKRRPNTPSSLQKQWLNALQGFGWRALVCYGATEAIHALETYIKAPKTIAVPEYVRDIPF